MMNKNERDQALGAVAGGLLVQFPEFPVVVYFDKASRTVKVGLLGEVPEPVDFYLPPGEFDRVADLPERIFSESIALVIEKQRPHNSAVRGSDSERTRTSNQLIKSQA